MMRRTSWKIEKKGVMKIIVKTERGRGRESIKKNQSYKPNIRVKTKLCVRQTEQRLFRQLFILFCFGRKMKKEI